MASTRIDDAIPTECRDTIVPTPTAGGHRIDNATVVNVEDTRGEYVGGGFGHDTSVEVVVLPHPIGRWRVRCREQIGRSVIPPSIRRRRSVRRFLLLPTSPPPAGIRIITRNTHIEEVRAADIVALRRRDRIEETAGGSIRRQEGR